ncbi:MAG: chemotaxis protein CheW [Spirochaetia bacterium]|nr:chemotaxis protein CheW [Spirochaetia bacterium]
MNEAVNAVAEQPKADEKKDRGEKIDFKMVTFVLAGKEYGIDIMNVKEIAHAGRFTYVPNAAPFVRGVYNLRGEIISIIDLRTMFHLPAERKDEGALENLLILQIHDQVFGIIVDQIDKVVGINRSSIQPPHPIFGDINVKYIRGIVENLSKLYIILDVEKIFMPKAKEEKEDAYRHAVPVSQAAANPSVPTHLAPPDAADDDLELGFIREALAALRNFATSPINEAWFRHRFDEWKTIRSGRDLQLKEGGEADLYLEGFFSPYTGELWGQEYVEAFEAILPAVEGASINVWNPGCGKGFETWSIACALKRKYPNGRIKIWANDSDLLNISMAPNMVFSFDVPPDYYAEFMVQGRNGWSFRQDIRDAIFFEFHDVLNTNSVPPSDLIVCRDMLSFLNPLDQKRVVVDFAEKLKKNGVAVVGANERLDFEGWEPAGTGVITAYAKA